MRSLLKRIFIENWLRKLISVVLAMITMFVVSQSLTSTKTISSIPIRIINIPEGKTVDGIQSNGFLNRRVTLTLTGNKSVLEDLNANDLEVVIDASTRTSEWIETITKKNLISLNPEINISRSINRVFPKNFIIKIRKLSSEKVPVIITQPIGEPPKGYQFLDVWPYKLYVTIEGPEDVLKKLKSRGIKLTFNLNDISKSELDDLKISSVHSKSDVVSYYVPAQWKEVDVSSISPNPIEINDPDAKFLRIDFLKSELIPLNFPIPVSFYLPPPYNSSINPQKLHIQSSDIIENRNGLKLLNLPLSAKGTSELFIEIIKDMIEIVVLVTPKAEHLDWSLQFINSPMLENKYLSTVSSDVSGEEVSELQPQRREEYLRNRFRNYMNRLQLFKQNDKKLNLSATLQGNTIIITEKNG